MAEPRIVGNTNATHKQLVDSLIALSNRRSDDGKWQDDEVEREPTETQSYKRLDALSCFIKAAKYSRVWSRIEKVVKPWLEKDVQNVFTLINSDGFFPSPYSFHVCKDDQAVDFACDVLHLCCDILDSEGSVAIGEDILRLFAIKAFDLLTTEGNFHRSESSGCAWAPTNVNQRGGPTPYNTYFTAVFVLAVERCARHPRMKDFWEPTRCEKAKALVKGACKYILSCSKDGVIFSGAETNFEPKNLTPYEKLVYSCWGLRALLVCWKELDKEQQRIVEAVAEGFLNLLKEPIKGKKVFHHTISASGSGTYFEHRTEHGGIITTLVEMKRCEGLKKITEEDEFRQKVDGFRNELFAMQDPDSNLWYNGEVSVSAMPSIVTDLLLFGDEFSDLDVELNLNLAKLKPQIKEVLTEAKILDTIAKIVADGLYNYAAHEDTEKILGKMQRASRGGPKRKPQAAHSSSGKSRKKRSTKN